MTTLVAVARNKFARGFDGSGRRVPDAYEVVEITDALSRAYASDAHLVTYVVRDASRQPRINKAGLANFNGNAETTVFFCDVDNPDHRPWSDELVARARAEYESLDVLRTCGIYHTAHGRRIVQPLKKPIERCFHRERRCCAGRSRRSAWSPRTSVARSPRSRRPAPAAGPRAVR